MKKTKIEIEGMSCGGCEGHVKDSLAKIDGAKNISVDSSEGKALLEIEDNVTKDQLEKAVKDAGYDPKKIEFE